ncbi:Gldg family protein [Pedobacter hiemivivus]|uniref:ABC transporter permease n=1 Tax=Pedobacter hiemivivus TaxID=2530454 RepID=A0A4R0N8T0_9SPHI|nr:Gldg family protein [Pedobacter hiemivivus]TCC96551.1 ABC transporter permease [Pedobacter hiemivivus]
MNKILKIAGAELKVLFYSPIAWLVLIIFTVHNGINFFELISSLRKQLLLGDNMSMITAEVYSGIFGLFTKSLAHLYLYFPLLTMGLMSRETSSGSIKLLLSSPVKTREIILGKYLAMVIYSFLLLCLLLLYVLAGNIAIKDMDYTLVISGLIGLFLLMCTFSAIGLFLSTLTSYQVVAAIGTLLVLAGLQYIGRVWKDIDILRDITSFLSIQSKSNIMIAGMLTSRDVFYYLLIIILFLCFSLFRLQSVLERKSFFYVAGKYITIVIVILLLGYASARPEFIYYKDMTATKARTISVNSQKIAKQIEGDLTITTYVNLLNNHFSYGMPEERNADLESVEGFRRFIPGLKMLYVYYYDYSTDPGISRNFINGPGSDLSKGAKRMADSMKLNIGNFLTPSEIKKRIDLSGEDNRLIRQLTYKGKHTFLRFYNDMINIPTEQEMVNALQRLLATPPLITFIKANVERSPYKLGDKGYTTFFSRKDYRTALINCGFDLMEVDLKKSIIPEKTTVLVLADPTNPLSYTEIEKIEQYIHRGGNIIIAGEPGKQDLINPLLQSLGVALKPEMVIDTANASPEVIAAAFAPGSSAIDTILPKLAAFNAVVSMPGVAGLSIDPRKGFEANTIMNNARDKTPLMVAVRRKLGNTEQRILVSGDADFISNAGLMRRSNGTPFLGRSIFSWFTNRQFPVDIDRPEAQDNQIRISRKGLMLLKLAIGWLVPALLTAAGAFMLINRKRK